VTELTTIAPIVKTLHVECPPEEAFRVFTAGIGTWWPTETHAVRAGAVEEVVFKEWAGGEVYEVSADGTRAHWARVLVWEPPSRVVLAWHVNPERAAPTEIEVTIAPDGRGSRVTLEHRNWERLGSEGPDARASYLTGWDAVLARFTGRLAAV
jgi:hypothetical protein